VQIIMIVKGNMRQVSFLHVYHHVTISIIWCVLACACHHWLHAFNKCAILTKRWTKQHLRMSAKALCDCALSNNIFKQQPCVSQASEEQLKASR
jgi:hypothetical protein